MVHSCSYGGVKTGGGSREGVGGCVSFALEVVEIGADSERMGDGNPITPNNNPTTNNNNPHRGEEEEDGIWDRAPRKSCSSRTRFPWVIVRINNNSDCGGWLG